MMYSGYSLWTVVGAAAGLYVALKLFQAVYAVFFHPLHNIPGPWWAAVTRVPYAVVLVRGTVPSFLQSLHAKYGPVVRYSPNEISVTKGDEAWQEIYGFRTGKQKGTQSFQKDKLWYAPGVDGIPSMLIASDEDHGRQRRIVSHAFSERSLHNQEWLIQKYANLLVSRIKETDIAEGKVSDLNEWYTWTTFDVIADLTFGRSLGCLESKSTHRFVKAMIDGIKSFPIFYCIHHWPTLQRIYRLVVGEAGSIKQRNDWIASLKGMVAKRIDAETDRHDFMTDILNKVQDEESKGKEGMTRGEITSNANLMMGAGTETTATVLQGVTFLVLQNPKVYETLCKEVRGRFKSLDDITIDAANSLTYTIAVLTEAMRLFPAVPAGFLRKVPLEGTEISGCFIPGNCNASISMSQHASYTDSSNFRDADKFVPERWLGDERYKDDNRATFSPFSFGPRNCLGKNLAYAEMRVFFSKMIFAFDMELAPGSEGWMDRCRGQALWAKPALPVKLTAV